MKKLLPLLVLFCYGCKPVPAPVPPPPPADFTVTITFNFDFTNYVPCSATVTKGCVSGFQWGYMQGATPVALKTSPPTICSGTNPEPCTDTTNATVGIGTIVPYVITQGIDNTGNAITAPSGTGPGVPVALASAINVGMTLK